MDKEIKIVEEKLMEEIRARESLEEELSQAEQFIEELKSDNEQLQ